MKKIAYPKDYEYVPSADNSGFSLVEILLALSLLSFCIVAIIGMMSVGITTFKSSVDSTVQSHIVQLLLNDISESQAVSLSSTTTMTYYDFSGQTLSVSSGAYYTASLSASNVTPFGTGTTFSGKLATLTISAKTDPKNPRVYTAIIAN